MKAKVMARISYVTPEEISNPECRQWLEDSIARGRPGPENQAIRAHQPDVMRSFTITRKLLFSDGAGVVDKKLKELIRSFIAHNLKCEY